MLISSEYGPSVLRLAAGQRTRHHAQLRRTACGPSLASQGRVSVSAGPRHAASEKSLMEGQGSSGRPGPASGLTTRPESQTRPQQPTPPQTMYAAREPTTHTARARADAVVLSVCLHIVCEHVCTSAVSNLHSGHMLTKLKSMLCMHFSKRAGEVALGRCQTHRAAGAPELRTSNRAPMQC